MRKQQSSRNRKPERIRRERDPLPWRYCLLTIVCGLIFVVGFFWAARQHFSAMDYSIRNAKMRHQKENLESEQRRFQLAREIALSPGEIKRAARKIGLRDMTAKSIETISPKIAPENPATEKLNGEKLKQAVMRKTLPEKPIREDTKKDESTDEKKAPLKEELKKPEAKIEKKPEVRK